MFAVQLELLENNDVRRLQTFLASLYIELNLLSFFKSAEAVTLNR